MSAAEDSHTEYTRDILNKLPVVMETLSGLSYFSFSLGGWLSDFGAEPLELGLS